MQANTLYILNSQKQNMHIYTKTKLKTSGMALTSLQHFTTESKQYKMHNTSIKSESMLVLSM